MCPKCSPNNFCRDPKHGNSEDNPAHKSSCRICSHDYFNNVSNEQVSGREGGNVGYQRVGYQYRGRCGKCGKSVTKSHKFCFHCSHDYFNNVLNEQVSGREGNSRGNQPMHNHSRHNSYGEGRGRGGRRGPYTRLCRDCRTDISNRYETHQQCKDCWSRDRSGRGGREGQRKGPYQRNKQTRSPRRDVKDVLGRRSRDRGEVLSTLTPRVNDNSTLNRVLRESARQSPERQLLRRRLFWRGLRENEVDGDGNCQFRAIADQLYGSPDRYAEVRANIVEHLRSNSSRYSAFVPESYDAFFFYIEIMRLDGNWGDHLTLQAASNVYGLEIRVYTSYDGNWERVIRPTDDGNIRRAIQLSFYAELHYNSVYPNTEFDSDDYEQINENLLNERTKLRHRAKFNRVPSIYSRYNGDEWVNRRLRQIDSELDTNHSQMQKKRMQKKTRS